MHTDTSPTAVGDRMRPLNRRILRKHLSLIHISEPTRPY